MTGELAWHFQVVPHDVWDYDAAYESILVDLPVNGRLRKLLIHPNKAGYVIVLDRTDGEFIAGWKYAWGSAERDAIDAERPPLWGRLGGVPSARPAEPAPGFWPSGLLAMAPSTQPAPRVSIWFTQF